MADHSITLGMIICIMLLSIATAWLSIDRIQYQEECVQSHVEPQAWLNYSLKGTERIDRTIETQDIRIMIPIGEITVCDKYALVRYADEVKE